MSPEHAPSGGRPTGVRHFHRRENRKPCKSGVYLSDISVVQVLKCASDGLPLEQAARRLGVGVTALRKLCRRIGMPRWPYTRSGGAQPCLPQGESEPHSSAACTDSGRMSGKSGLVPGALVCGTQESQCASLPPATPTSCAPLSEAAAALSWQQQDLSRQNWQQQRDLSRQGWQEQGLSGVREVPIASGAGPAPGGLRSSSGEGVSAVRRPVPVKAAGAATDHPAGLMAHQPGSDELGLLLRGFNSGGTIAEQLAAIVTLLQALPSTHVQPASQHPQQAATASFHTAATNAWDVGHSQVARSFTEPLAARPAAQGLAPALQRAVGGLHCSAFQPYGALPATAAPAHSRADAVGGGILGNPSAGALLQALSVGLGCCPTIPLHRAASDPVPVPHAAPAAAPSYHASQEERLAAARQLLQGGILAQLCSLLAA